MTSILIAAAVAVLTFGSGMLGLYLQQRLPKHHMSGGSKDMILAVIGLVTLLLALVLGTLVGNTYASFAMQKSELETMALTPATDRGRGPSIARRMGESSPVSVRMWPAP